MWSRTLAELVSDVTDRCDVTGFTARHSTAVVRRKVLESYQALRDWMTSAGSRRWSVGPVQLSMTLAQHLEYCVQVPLMAGSGSPVPYERPSTLLTKIGGEWTELKPITVGELFDYCTPSDARTAPQAWALQGNPAQAQGIAAEGTVGGQFTLMISPDFDLTAYPIYMFAQSVIDVTDADGTTITLDGPGFEWLIWDAATKVIARDNDTAGTYAIAVAERQRAEDRILKGIADERQTVVQRRDVFHGRSRFGRGRRY